MDDSKQVEIQRLKAEAHRKESERNLRRLQAEKNRQSPLNRSQRRKAKALDRKKGGDA